MIKIKQIKLHAKAALLAVNTSASIILWLFILLFFLNIHAFHDILLRTAVANGCTGAAKTLLYFGANVHADNDLALKMAAKNGDTEIVRSLLNHGADIHANNDMALYMAVKNGHVDVVKLFLDKEGFNLTCYSLWSRAAKESGKEEIVHIIHERLTSISNECLLDHQKEINMEEIKNHQKKDKRKNGPRYN